jgi:hypothetical protein
MTDPAAYDDSGRASHSVFFREGELVGNFICSAEDRS